MDKNIRNKIIKKIQKTKVETQRINKEKKIKKKNSN